MMPTRTTTVTTYGPDGKATGTTTQTYDVSVEQDNRDQIAQNAMTAMTVNRTFLALPTPTTAQLAAQVSALTRQNQRIIRLLLGLLDATD